jgi:hypothetical protein
MALAFRMNDSGWAQQMQNIERHVERVGGSPEMSWFGSIA